EILEKADDDVFGTYLHMGGQIGVLTLLEGTTDENVARDVSMHVAAINPSYISSDDVAEEEANDERGIVKTQALKEGKQEKKREKNVAIDVSMHVAAMNPSYISRDDVAEEEVNHEREILKTQALNEGKPEHIVEKMVEGRLGKFFEEICLLEQQFVKNPDQKV